MLAMASTWRPLMKTVGVELTSRLCPRSIDFLMRGGVSGGGGPGGIGAGSSRAAVASSFSLSSAVARAMPPWFSKMLPAYFQKPSLLARPAQSAYCAAFIAQGCRLAGSGDCWKTNFTWGKSVASFLRIGCAALQCGHSRSLNATILITPFCGPCEGPSAACSFARAGANGLAPNGMMLPTMAFCDSVEMYMCWGVCLLMENVTSTAPEISEGLMSMIVQFTAGS